MKKLVLNICVFLIVSGIVFGQDDGRAAKTRGLEILSLARKAVYKDTPITEFKNIRIRVFSKIRSKSESKSGIYKITRTADSFQLDSYSFGKNGEVRIEELNDENEVTFKLFVTDGNQHFEKYGTLKNGKFLDNKIFPPLSDKLIKESITGYTYLISPIFLHFPEDVAIRYLGKAEAPEGRADVVGIKLNNGNETKYLFDEKSHLLLMTVRETKISTLQSKTTYYFSDHRLINGMLIPTIRKKRATAALYSRNSDSKVPERVSTFIDEAKIKLDIDQTFDKDEFTDKFDAKILEKRAKSLGKVVKDLLDEG